MKETGKLLKEAREGKGVSLGEVSLATKINTRILKALEEGDLENLPPKTFLRGFVQAYAQYLRLDLDVVMRTFQTEMGTTKPETRHTAGGPSDGAGTSHDYTPPSGTTPSPSADHIEQVNSQSQNFVFKLLGGGLCIAVLFAAIIIVKGKMDAYREEGVITEVPEVEALPTDETANLPSGSGSGSETGGVAGVPIASGTPALSTPAITPKPGASPIATAAPVATPRPSPTAGASPRVTATATPRPSPSPVVSPSPKPSPKVTATPATTPNASPTARPTATPKPSPAASTPPPLAANAAREIIVEALGPVDVEVIIDGKTEKFTLGSDDLRTLRSTSPIRLKISNGGAVNISRNGRDLGVPGAFNKAVDLTY